MRPDIYTEAIKALANNTSGQGHLPKAEASVMLDNPLCGDRVRIDVVLRDGRLLAMAHEVKGCLLCRAATALVQKNATGLTVLDIKIMADAVTGFLDDENEYVRQVPEMSIFYPVRSHRSRIGCVSLPFRVLLATMVAAGKTDASN